VEVTVMKAGELFEQVTADLVAAIEAGASDWRMPWQRLAAAGVPRSVDGRPYRGWNALVLAMAAANRGWLSSTWATYRAWQRHGGQVRRGERGTHVVLWKPIDRRADDDPAHDGARPGPSLFARTFTVFAAEQVDGTLVAQSAADPADEPARLGSADSYFERVAASITYGGDLACYVPAADIIRMPELARFDRPADFYSTAAHEHVHWTGHRSRLDRDLSGRFGDRAYGAEELIAELGAAFWCAQFQLEQATRADHAAYLGDWLAILRQDARALVATCSQAQRAIDYLNTIAGWPDMSTTTEAAPG
jgi:antirestriction protein ArdC